MSKPTAPSLPEWTCQFTDQLQKIEVGDRLKLVCEGDAVTVNIKNLQIKLPDEQKYTLVLKDILKISEHGAELSVVSYRPGPHKWAEAQLSDGQAKVSLKLPELQIQSVIDPQNPPKQPYGPFGPMLLGYPMWMWITLACFVLATILISVITWRRRRARKRLFDKISGVWVDPRNPESCADYNTPLSPYHQFTKTLRHLNRELPVTTEENQKVDQALLQNYAKKLEHAYKLFLARELIVPTLDWKMSAVFVEIKRRYPKMYSRYGKELKSIWLELEHSNAATLRTFDCTQLGQLCLKAVEKVMRSSVKGQYMNSWHSPWAFLLFIPLVILFAQHFFWRTQKRATVRFSARKNLDGLPKGLRSQLVELPTVIAYIAAGFTIVALARPQTSDTKVKRNVEGIDIMLVLDISDSMLIEDMRPVNRMEAAKKTIREFIDGRVSDRIGLTVFSGEAYTRVPLTLDYALLRKSLSEVEPSRNIKMGTAIGVALANAVGRLRDSTARSRVIVFLTDGENNSGTIDPETALDMAEGYKLRIYSIGVGKDGQAQLPIMRQDAFGRTVKTYQPIHSKVNDELLGKFAQETGGKYYRATNGQALANVFRDIDRLEKTRVDVNQFTRYQEKYYPYLLTAVLLFLLQQILATTLLRRVP